MRKFYQYLSVCLFALLAVSCAKDEVEVTGSIIGIVTDASTGETPVQGATITLNPLGLKATTGSDGRYEFQDLGIGQYTVQVQAAGYKTTTMRIDVIAGKQSSCDISLTPLQMSSEVSASPKSLSFGLNTSSLTFTLHNTGNQSTSWNISGLEPWLSVSPLTGTIGSGKSQVVKVTVDRSQLEKTTTASIVINVDDGSLSLPITVEMESATSLLKLSTSRLDFGTDYDELSFQIQNKGNAGDVAWSITEVSVPWVKVSPLRGTTEMGKSSAVKVTVDRSLVTEAATTTILVSAEGESLPLVIAVEPKAAEDRYVLFTPENLDFGEDKTSQLILLGSYNGPTDYKLYVSGDAPWLTFSDVEGTIAEYDTALGADSYTRIYAYVDRSGLTAGKYSCTIIVRTDLGDYRIPVSMTVPSTGGGGSGDEPVSGTIESCDSRIAMELLSVRRSGSTVTCTFSMTNNGDNLASVDLYNNGVSYAYDNEGGYYTYDMGTYNMELKLADSGKSGNFIRKPFPSGVTLQCEIKFTNVPSSVTSFTNITMFFRTYASSWEFDNDYIVIKNLEI